MTKRPTMTPWMRTLIRKSNTLRGEKYYSGARAKEGKRAPRPITLRQIGKDAK